MKRILSIFLALTLVFSFAVVLSPQSTYAATDYCKSNNLFGSSTGYGNVKVYNGDLKSGACHIDYYHQAAVGKESVKVDGVSKSQFSSYNDRANMATVAGQVIANATPVKLSNGNYRAEFFNIMMNQYVRVLYYKKVENNTTYKIVITMYPIKSIKQ